MARGMVKDEFDESVFGPFKGLSLLWLEKLKAATKQRRKCVTERDC
jgi:hypothetical protein